MLFTTHRHLEPQLIAAITQLKAAA